MKKLILTIVILVLSAAALPAQECIFKFADDDSFEKAKTQFHDVMADLLHGPVEKGDIEPVRARIGELVAGRDALMAANLPEKYKDVCPEISANAVVLSNTVDALAELVKNEAGEGEIKDAFMKVHEAYRSVAQSMLLVQDLLDAFHDVIQPVWHEAYPDKDIEAIKKAVPSLKVRAKLIVQISGKVESEAFKNGAQELLESVVTLEEALAAEDAEATLTAVELMHDAYHALTEIEVN
jgi:hypothetical protein